MLLAVDVSSRLIAVGFYWSMEFKRVSVVSVTEGMTEDDFALRLQGLCALYGVEEIPAGAIVSSVAPSITGVVTGGIRRLFGTEAVLIGPGIKTGLNIRINDPSELGADLVAMAAGVVAGYELPAMFVHMGDTMAIGYIDENKVYTGTVIYAGMPGVLKTLVENAELLHAVRFAAPQKILGTDTAESMQSGLVYGTAFVVDGFIDRIKQERPCRTVVITGKYADVIRPYLKQPVIADKTLLTDGLFRIYEKQKRL